MLNGPPHMSRSSRFPHFGHTGFPAFVAPAFNALSDGAFRSIA